MAKNEKTGKKVASLASKALKGKKLTREQSKSLGGGALTQAPDRKKSSKKRK